MSEPTSVNSQITDTVSQSAISTAGATGAVAQTALAHGFVQALTNAMQGASLQQQSTQTLADAALTASLQALGAESSSIEGL